MKANLFITAFGVVALWASSALADFVCAVTYDPVPSNLGSEGGVSITLNSARKCRGEETGIKRFCTSGATNTGCAASVFLTEPALLAMHSDLVNAAASNLRVSGQVATCHGGAVTCWSNLSFFAQ
jgi:hypothetical protein